MSAAAASLHANDKTMEQLLQERIAVLEQQNAALLQEQNDDGMDRFLVDAGSRLRRICAPRPMMALRNQVRRPTLKILEQHLRQKQTTLFRRKKTKKLDIHGKHKKTVYYQLHYPTFVKLARPALEELCSEHIGNDTKCSKILNAMIFVTRWRRRNHLTNFRKEGVPMPDIYSYLRQVRRHVPRLIQLHHQLPRLHQLRCCEVSPVQDQRQGQW